MQSLVTLNEYSIFLIGSGICLIAAGVVATIATIRKR